MVFIPSLMMELKTGDQELALKTEIDFPYFALR